MKQAQAWIEAPQVADKEALRRSREEQTSQAAPATRLWVTLWYSKRLVPVAIAKWGRAGGSGVEGQQLESPPSQTNDSYKLKPVAM